MKFMAAHAMWSCVASTCGSGGAPEESFSVPSCKELAKKVGKITAFGDDRHKMSAEELEKCNSAAGH